MDAARKHRVQVRIPADEERYCIEHPSYGVMVEMGDKPRFSAERLRSEGVLFYALDAAHKMLAKVKASGYRAAQRAHVQPLNDVSRRALEAHELKQNKGEPSNLGRAMRATLDESCVCGECADCLLRAKLEGARPDDLWFPLSSGETTLLRRALIYYCKSFHADGTPNDGKKRTSTDLNQLVADRRENEQRDLVANALDEKLLKQGRKL